MATLHLNNAETQAVLLALELSTNTLIANIVAQANAKPPEATQAQVKATLLDGIEIAPLEPSGEAATG